MPSYKLTYFDGRGRAESSRLLLALAGQKFEDVRVAFPEWPEVKKKMPLGNVPVLEVDGKILIQSRAIASYLARQHGFYGANSWEAALVDQFNGVVEDLWFPLVQIIFEQDESAKKSRIKTYFEEKAPPLLTYLEDQLSKNNEGRGFFVGKKISLADLNFHTSMDTIEAADYANKGLEKYPKLAALRARISAHEKLAPYLAKRKKTDK